MIDFDKLFEEYCVNWYNSNSNDMTNADKMEEALPSVYEEWANSPCDSINGITPREFFEKISDADELIKLLLETSEGDNSPCSLLLDRIVEVELTANGLNDIIKGEYSVEQKMLAINLLQEMGVDMPLDLLVSWLVNPKIKDELVEMAIEILRDNAKAVQEKLYPLINKASNAQKTCIAEILVDADKDERTYNLLMELFSLGDNIPLYAGYIGKYGDERAAATLYRALDTCNYMEYIEIKNAIERMGGVVDDSRDFTDDIYFKAIKNIK